MFETLELMRMADSLARYASDRQAVIAQNVANADTPGYRSKDLPSFSEVYEVPKSDGMRTTRAGHLERSEVERLRETVIDAPGASSPNGNTVSLELEMVRAAEIRQSYEMALGAYGASLDMLRSALGRR